MTDEKPIRECKLEKRIGDLEAKVAVQESYIKNLQRSEKTLQLITELISLAR